MKDRLELNISYDDEADVVYVSLGEPQAAEAEEFDRGVVGRYDPETGKLVGITFLHFKKHFSEAGDIKIPLSVSQPIS